MFHQPSHSVFWAVRLPALLLLPPKLPVAGIELSNCSHHQSPNITGPAGSAAEADGDSIRAAFAGVDSSKAVNFIDFNGYRDPCGADFCMDHELHTVPSWFPGDALYCNWPVVACENHRVIAITLRADGSLRHPAAAMTGDLQPSLLPDSLLSFTVASMPGWTNDVPLTFPAHLGNLHIEGVGWGGSDLANIFIILPQLFNLHVEDRKHTGSLGFPTEFSFAVSIKFLWLPRLDEGPLDLHLETVNYWFMYELEMWYAKRAGPVSLRGIDTQMSDLEALGLSGNNFANTDINEFLNQMMPVNLEQLYIERTG